MKNFSSFSRFLNMFRKHVLPGTCIALLVFAGIIFCLELTDRVIFRPKSIFARSIEDFEKQKGEVQILFCGASDVKYGIVPDEFPNKTFNFAGTGENYMEIYYKLKHYIQDMPELKLVVLSVGLASFSAERTSELNWEYFTYGYINYRDFMELYKMQGSKVIGQRLLSFCPILDRLQMKLLLGNLKRLFTHQRIDKTEMISGYVKYEGSEVDEATAIKRVKREFEGNDIFDENTLLYFKKILELCRDHGVTVVTLTLPVTDQYLKHSAKYVNKEMIYQKIFMDPSYSRMIYRHLDFLDEKYGREHDLFLNQDHFNYKGALKFSRMIAAECSAVLREIQAGADTENVYDRTGDETLN